MPTERENETFEVGVRYEPIVDLRFEIAKLKLEPGDVLVVRLKDRVTADTVAKFRYDLKQVTGGHKCMILDNGTDLAVLAVAQIKAKTETQEEHAG